MLTAAKKNKMIAALKGFKKTYLDKQYGDLDESATRLMVNHFLTEVLDYKMIEEIKTEYMIRGTYADYVIQITGVRHFLIEVKALQLELSEKHLRQAVNYGANEGIEWVLLTNARKFELYRILFEKPIDSVKVFSLDFADVDHFNEDVEFLQYLHRDSVLKKELEVLWKKHSALKPAVLAGFLFGKPVINFLKRELNSKFKSKFSDDEIKEAVKKVITEATCLGDVKPIKEKKKKDSIVEAKSPTESTEPSIPSQQV